MRTNLINRSFVVFICLCVIGLVLIGCHQFPDPDPLQSPMVSPLQSPISPRVVLPTPSSSEVATVGGVLMRDIEGQEIAPMSEAKVYLADVLRSESGDFLALAAGEESPTSISDETGTFVFTDVLSETYGLAIDTPLGTFLIHGAGGEDFLFTVRSDEVLNLGEIYVDFPY